jgi:soluble P-type ATPase
VIEIEIPGRGTYRLRHPVLDVNGTIAVEGELVEGVAGRVAVETLRR